MGKFITSYMILPMILSGCSLFDALPDDNFVEEYIEDVIEEQTGVEIDFTGDSEE